MAARPVTAHSDCTFIDSLNTEMLRLGDSLRFSETLEILETWSSICQWYQSIDKTKVKALRDKITQWTLVEPRAQKIQRHALQMFGYMDHPNVDSRDKLLRDLLLLTVFLTEWAYKSPSGAAQVAARMPARAMAAHAPVSLAAMGVPVEGEWVTLRSREDGSVFKMPMNACIRTADQGIQIMPGSEVYDIVPFSDDAVLKLRIPGTNVILKHSVMGLRFPKGIQKGFPVEIVPTPYRARRGYALGGFTYEGPLQYEEYEEPLPKEAWPYGPSPAGGGFPSQLDSEVDIAAEVAAIERAYAERDRVLANPDHPSVSSDVRREPEPDGKN